MPLVSKLARVQPEWDRQFDWKLIRRIAKEVFPGLHPIVFARLTMNEASFMRQNRTIDSFNLTTVFCLTHVECRLQSLEKRIKRDGLQSIA